MLSPARVDAIVDLAYGALIVLAIAMIATFDTDTGIAFGVGVFAAYVLHVVWKMARFDPNWMTQSVQESIQETVGESVEEHLEERVGEEVGRTVEERVDETVERTVGERLGEVEAQVEAVEERVEQRPEEVDVEELIDRTVDGEHTDGADEER